MMPPPWLCTIGALIKRSMPLSVVPWATFIVTLLVAAFRRSWMPLEMREVALLA